jgi:hypothetical protein
MSWAEAPSKNAGIHRASEIGVAEILATEAQWAEEVGANRVKALRETLERLTQAPVDAEADS